MFAFNDAPHAPRYVHSWWPLLIKISKVATNMRTPARYRASVKFLKNAGDDWRKLIDLVGPCLHDPKAAREPYEALVRAIAYQQLTAKAGDAIIGRLKALYPETLFPAPEDLVSADFEALRGCGFSGAKIATIKAISEGALSGLVPTREVAVKMDDEVLIERIASIKGIGRWTVEMLLMYSLERMDILPVDAMNWSPPPGKPAAGSGAIGPDGCPIRTLITSWG